MASDRSWPPMVWIGGAQGAGKSTVARTLSRTLDLPLHPIDLWTYDHAARLDQADTLDDELARGPAAAADAFEAHARARLELVVDDVAGHDLGPVPAIVEGPQLLPFLAERMGRTAAAALRPALAEATRLVAGADLAEQRRVENQVACRQGRSWQATVGIDVPPPYPFACECGGGGCTATWMGGPDDYDAKVIGGPLSPTTTTDGSTLQK